MVEFFNGSLKHDCIENIDTRNWKGRVHANLGEISTLRKESRREIWDLSGTQPQRFVVCAWLSLVCVEKETVRPRSSVSWDKEALSMEGMVVPCYCVLFTESRDEAFKISPVLCPLATSSISDAIILKYSYSTMTGSLQIHLED